MTTNINKDNSKIKLDMNDNDNINNSSGLAGRGGLAGEAARSNPMGDQVLRLRMSTGTATDRVLRLIDCNHSFLLGLASRAGDRGAQLATDPVWGSVDFMTVTVKNLRLDDAACGAHVAAHAAVEPMPAFGLCDAFFWLFHCSLYYFAFYEHRSPYYFAVRAAALLLPGSFIVIIIFVLTQICILINKLLLILNVILILINNFT